MEIKTEKDNRETQYQRLQQLGIEFNDGDQKLHFYLNDDKKNYISIGIKDFLFGNQGEFKARIDGYEYPVRYEDDALLIGYQDEGFMYIFDFKQMLNNAELDSNNYPYLDDMKGLLTRVIAAQKKSQAQGQFQQNNDDDLVQEAEDEIISAIYTDTERENNKRIKEAAAYMHLNDYINGYADKELTNDERGVLKKICEALSDPDRLDNKIQNAIESQDIDLNKIFIALMYIAKDPNALQHFYKTVVEKCYYEKIQKKDKSLEKIDMNAVFSYGALFLNENLEKIIQDTRNLADNNCQQCLPPVCRDYKTTKEHIDNGNFNYKDDTYSTSYDTQMKPIFSNINYNIMNQGQGRFGPRFV